MVRILGFFSNYRVSIISNIWVGRKVGSRRPSGSGYIWWSKRGGGDNFSEGTVDDIAATKHVGDGSSTVVALFFEA